MSVLYQLTKNTDVNNVIFFEHHKRTAYYKHNKSNINLDVLFEVSWKKSSADNSISSINDTTLELVCETCDEEEIEVEDIQKHLKSIVQLLNGKIEDNPNCDCCKS